MLGQVLVSGITAGAVYALVALGFVVLHRGTRVVHFGLGDQLTLSAYAVVVGQVFLGLPFWAAILLSLALFILMTITISWFYQVRQRIERLAHEQQEWLRVSIQRKRILHGARLAMG